MQRRYFNAQDRFGNAQSGYKFSVYDMVTGNAVAIYSDDGLTEIIQPVDVDSVYGAYQEFWFYAPNGRYKIVLSGTVSEIWSDILFFDPVGEGVALRYDADNTSAPPAEGYVYFNNADLSSATEAYVSVTNLGGSDIETLLQEFYDATRSRKDIAIFKAPDSTKQVSFRITGLSVSTGSHVTFTLTYLDGETSFDDDEQLGLWVLMAGPDGSTSGDVGSNDNRVVRTDGATGVVVQGSSVVLDDAGRVLSKETEGAMGAGPISELNTPPNNDCDDCDGHGWYVTDYETVNSPQDMQTFFLRTIGDQDLYQEAMAFDDPAIAFARERVAGVWGPWIRTRYQGAEDSDVMASLLLPQRLLLASHLRTANKPRALTFGTPTAWDWFEGFNRILTMTGDCTLSDPTNGVPGQWHTLIVEGNDATERTMTFDTGYKTTNLASGAPSDITSTKRYMFSVYCESESDFIAFEGDAS